MTHIKIDSLKNLPALLALLDKLYFLAYFDFRIILHLYWFVSAN